tara:strand:- start:1113 stop:1289 length:177 start_codon:yes stop_codon:yes gene_type:complete
MWSVVEKVFDEGEYCKDCEYLVETSIHPKEVECSLLLSGPPAFCKGYDDYIDRSTECP